MDNFSFRRLTVPALLAAGAGLAALTGSLAPDRTVQVSDQHREVSIRYGGFAVLSSAAIGIGTAEARRTRQGRRQRPQGLLDQVLRAYADQTVVEGDRPPADSPDTVDSADLAGASEKPVSAAAALDWVSLLHTTSGNHSESNLLSTALDEHTLYHIQGANRCRCLALAVEGEYYRYYRHRPDLNKAWALVQHLQQQGKPAIATWDDNGYVVWVHQPERPQQIIPWPEATG